MAAIVNKVGLDKIAEVISKKEDSNFAKKVIPVTKPIVKPTSKPITTPITPSTKSLHEKLDIIDKALQGAYYDLTDDSKKNKKDIQKKYDNFVKLRKDIITGINAKNREDAGGLDATLEASLSSTLIKPMQKFGLIDEANQLPYDLPKLEDYKTKKEKENEKYRTSTNFEDLGTSWGRFKFRYNASNDNPIKVQPYGTRAEREGKDINIKSKGTLLHFLEESPITGFKGPWVPETYKALKDDDYLGVIKDNKLKYLTKEELIKQGGTPGKDTFIIHHTKFDDINFDKKVKDDNFAGHTYWTDKNTGKKTISISSAADESLYNFSSGQSTVFIFPYKGSRRYIHFSGSPSEIKKEGERIKKDYKLDDGKLVIGVADAGSYSANIRGDITNEKLNNKGTGYYNQNKNSGAGLAIID